MNQLPVLTLLAITGLPGTGKSDLADELLRHLLLERVDTDRCWLSLFPEPKYTPTESEKVFAFVSERVSSSLASGGSTVAEGVFASHDRIKQLWTIANEHGARFFIVRLHCDIATAFARMHSRYHQGGRKPVPIPLWLALSAKLRAWRNKEDVFWIDSTRVKPRTAVSHLLSRLARN